MSDTIRNISELEFQDIKSSLKNFLRSQSEFSDYDFEGSGLNILLDALAANTYYTAYYTNMMVNESFLDSAITRSSIISHAKTLGYTPKSMVASRAIINLQINTPTGNPASITIPKGTTFTASIDGKAYTFFTNETYTAFRNDNYLVRNILIYEGKNFTYRYTVNSTNPQKYVVPADNVDTDLLTVRIQNSTTDTTQIVYTKNKNATELNGTSRIYFLEENKEGRYELVFGDGILGAALQNGNIILMEYAVSTGEATNNLGTFTLSQPISGNSNVTITTIQKSFGGSSKETLASVKFTAPKNYQAQQRAVTISDYEALLPTLYSNAKSFKVWGGEDNDPPTFGKVFISVQPTEGYVITNTIKEFIAKTLLKPYSLVTIIPEIVDPEYVKIHINSTVKYNPNASILSEGQLRTSVISAILNYGQTQLNKFDVKFRYSTFTNMIDNVNGAIRGNLTDIAISLDVKTALNIRDKYTLNFNAAIDKGTLSSTGFRYLEDNLGGTQVHYFDDDSNGNLRTYRIVSGNKIYTDITAGTIDYNTGKITIDPSTFIATTLQTNLIQIKVVPTDYDVSPVRNKILLIESENITLTMRAEV